MKRILILLLLIVCFSCDSDKGLNCFQASGDIIQEEFTMPQFSRILVWERAQLIIQQGPVQKVVVETGENLLNDVELEVIDGQLNIYNHNGCNVVRDYGLTKVYVTSPNITEIRSSTGLPTLSNGVLSFPVLNLFSEDFNEEDFYHIDGDFRLELDVETLTLAANGLSRFYLNGKADRLNIGLYSGDGSVEAGGLITQHVSISLHRSTNRIVVNPQQSIYAKIVSIGDVIAKNHPPEVEKIELYTGRLIFE
ncbi:head GIN domain-containing protein [Ulvibacter antarcticus]|uniref:Putative autotransporter adhesin-like protein n=1 Tax=Ulvibacter antarcticus TaxID=442714 RepID=A0A3L9YCI4_9FLAO|nr:head GIN domain-containing protein [Ulvibacter antarcticus]RMA57207.1 putative autotransporter adhesin-like protein [Ulvibacter antarcticus]